MKKRILALLLAGVLTASLVSCVGGGEKDTDDQGSDNVTTDDGTDTGYKPSEDELEEDDYWIEETDTLYTHSTAYLREEPDGSADSVTTISACSKLTRTKFSSTWSYVTYVDEESGNTYEGYISNNYVTKTDITGADFEPVTGGTQTYYALNALNARKYPVAAEYSTVMGSYKKDDEITVVASNGTWLKVNYETDEDSGETLYYYVSALYVSAEKGGDPLATNSYEGAFVEVVPTKTMYTSEAGLRLRSEPVIDKSTILYTFDNAGVKVVVTKQGNVANESGVIMAWSYVTAFIPAEKVGDPATVKEGYIATEYLTEENPGILNLNSLSDILAIYPSFTKVDPAKVMYIVKNTNENTSVTLRATPEIKSSNVISSVVTKKDAVKPTEIKVVATNNADWYIMERTDAKGNISYAFITALPSFVTSDPTGAVKVTLENLIAAYPNFQLLETPRTITAEKPANGYYLPEVQKTVPYPMQTGASATLVAVETGAIPTWYVIDVSGTLYFVPMESFPPMEIG